MEIIGRLSDGSHGTPPKRSPPPKLPEFEINWSQKIQQGGRTVTMNMVQPPILLKEPELILENHEPLSAEQRAELQKQLREQFEHYRKSYFFVSATIYGRATLVKWRGLQNEGEELSCWSNVNFSHLGGFTSFKARGQEFTFIMAHGSQSLKALRQLHRQNPAVIVPKIPAELPKLRESGPHYIMVKGDEGSNDQAMEFMEALHDLYAAKRKELRRAYTKRVNQQRIRAEELRLNPPKPQDITLHFWNNDINAQ